MIYPALDEWNYLDASRRLAEEHRESKTFIYDLRRIASRDRAWILKAREFWTNFEQHMRNEEGEVFPAFRDRIFGGREGSADQHDQLGSPEGGLGLFPGARLQQVSDLHKQDLLGRRRALLGVRLGGVAASDRVDQLDH